MNFVLRFFPSLVFHNLLFINFVNASRAPGSATVIGQRFKRFLHNTPKIMQVLLLSKAE